MSSLSFHGVGKTYTGGVRAVRDFNLDIDDKEFIVIVGPSGCGKSTVLRMVAGLEEITDGDILIDGARINDVEPKHRDIAMVFQHYTLFPHLTVRENMAFGLKLRKVDKAVIEKKVNEAAEALGVTELLDRRPKELSGGQRQRIALGRAIVREPKVFLLDEPLSNLDAKLRVQMRTEIIKIHHRLNTTFIYVTHDQTEAMTMGTRIVVMNDGVIQQVATPADLYDKPINLFVASFLGSPQMNIFGATLGADGSKLFARIGETEIAIPSERAEKVDKSFVGKEVLLGIRPESLKCEVKPNNNRSIPAIVDVIENLGNEKIIYANTEVKEGYVVARIASKTEYRQGDRVWVKLDGDVHLFDPETEQSIIHFE